MTPIEYEWDEPASPPCTCGSCEECRAAEDDFAPRERSRREHARDVAFTFFDR